MRLLVIIILICLSPSILAENATQDPIQHNEPSTQTNPPSDQRVDDSLDSILENLSDDPFEDSLDNLLDNYGEDIENNEQGISGDDFSYDPYARDAAQVIIYDPYEESNRKVYAFNTAIDTYVLLPVVYVYDFVTPSFLQAGATNFFYNINEPYTMLNSALQLKMIDFYKSFFRFGINSIIGVAGLVDVASYMGVQGKREDYGQTIATWGVSAGPYLEVPFLGPSTSRDLVPRIAEFVYTPNALQLLPLSTGERWAFTVIGLLNARNNLRASEQLIIGDRYTFIRDAYLQNRNFQVLDGQISWEDFELEEVPDDLDDL